MRRYNQSNQIEVTKLIKSLNSINPDISVESVSGMLLNCNKQISAIVEYFELDPGETLMDVLKINFQLHIILSQSLNVPFFIIVYDGLNSGNYDIFDYHRQVWFKKNYNVNNGMSDFGRWWLLYKGTIQNKQYIKKALPFHINKSLSACNLKWGGDLDGIVYNNKLNYILSICEFRFSNYLPISKYDPNDFYNNDVMTWYPLILLKNTLYVPLYLVTLSKVDSKYGISSIIDGNNNTLFYRFNKKPNELSSCDANQIFEFISLS